VTQQRARDFWVLLPTLRYMAPGMLSMFLIGMWVARRRLWHDIPANRRLLARVVAICLPLGVAANAFLLVARDQASAGNAGWRLAVQAMLSLGGTLLCFAYAAGIALLIGQARWRRRLAPLGPAGRMSLSNYLMQSLVCTTMFYGYGLGLQGRFGAAAGAAFALGLWVAQVGLSTLWQRPFYFGPAEWLWRLLTYLRPPGMRRRPASVANAGATQPPSLL
jgi:uncharacterized protein